MASIPKRGARAQPLGPDCVEDPQTGKVSCQICHGTRSGACTWISRGSWKKHIDTPAHKAAKERTLEAAQAALRINNQYNDLYRMASTSLQAPPVAPNSAPPRPHFRPILDEDSNGVSTSDFDDIIMQQSDNFYRNQVATPIVDYTETLRREIELLKLRHLEEEFEGADDETVPQLAEELRNNGKSSNSKCGVTWPDDPHRSSS
ncbi:hypothetical protein C8J57DRAFT_1514165 [Mycena rebaudengoi]|nr:hypothetical protein C8J57DRAFT_1514165 [Mycena rebaudengoi]